MESVFRSFCSFGADKGAAAAPQMDGTKLVKLCRDLKLLDKNLTSTDVDIIYSKVKLKTERRINFKQFEEALKLIAEKKFPGTEDALDKLKVKILEGGGPVAHGTTKAAKTGAVDRLTDAAPSKAPSSGAAAAASGQQKATTADTRSKAKASAAGGNAKLHSTNATGKPTHSTNGRSDGKTGGGGLKSKSSGNSQKPIRAPNPDGKESCTASETMEKEKVNGKDSGLGKPDAQKNSDPIPDKGLQKNEDPLTVSGNHETQVRKEDS